jgi:hypothetical protein
VLKQSLAFKFGRKFSETETGWDFEKLTTFYPVLETPSEILIDNGSDFMSDVMLHLGVTYGIQLFQYSTYYLQGNGLAESTNKNLIWILKRTSRIRGMIGT